MTREERHKEKIKIINRKEKKEPLSDILTIPLTKTKNIVTQAMEDNIIFQMCLEMQRENSID